MQFSMSDFGFFNGWIGRLNLVGVIYSFMSDFGFFNGRIGRVNLVGVIYSSMSDLGLFSGQIGRLNLIGVIQFSMLDFGINGWIEKLNLVGVTLLLDCLKRWQSHHKCHHPHRFNEHATKNEKWNGKPTLECVNG